MCQICYGRHKAKIKPWQGKKTRKAVESLASQMMEVFYIPYPDTKEGKKQWTRRYGLNAYYSGKHWAVRKADADYWHRLARIEMDRQGVREEPFQSPVVLSFYWNDRLDCSNHAAMGKMIEDAMVGRVISGDSQKYVKGIEHYFWDGNSIKICVREV